MTFPDRPQRNEGPSNRNWMTALAFAGIAIVTLYIILEYLSVGGLTWPNQRKLLQTYQEGRLVYFDQALQIDIRDVDVTAQTVTVKVKYSDEEVTLVPGDRIPGTMDDLGYIHDITIFSVHPSTIYDLDDAFQGIFPLQIGQFVTILWDDLP